MNSEERNIRYLESRYMYEQRRNIYYANETTNQLHDEDDVADFVRAWKNEWDLSDIAEYLGLDMKEAQLFAVDLIHTGKIKGNLHIFKPKSKKGMGEIIFDGQEIRTVTKGSEKWVCLKDLWRWIGKPEHSFRKVVEGWGPDRRAKFKLETNGGLQNHIFINTQGLSDLCRHVEKNQMEMINRVLIAVDKRSAEAEPRASEQKRSGRVSRKNTKATNRRSKHAMSNMR